MRKTIRITAPCKAPMLTCWAVCLVLSWCSCSLGQESKAGGQALFQAVTDRITYNAGDQVHLKIIFLSPHAQQTQLPYRFTERYAGEEKSVAKELVLGSVAGSS